MVISRPKQEKAVPLIHYREHASGKPIFELPALTCDSHCHVFGPFDRYPMTGSRKYTPAEVPIDALRRHHDSLGVERAVIVHPSIHGTDNRVTLDAIATDPKRYRGVVNIDDTIPDAELERMHGLGIRGIRFNFNKNLGGFPDIDLVRRSVARVHGLNLPGWHLVMQIDGENVPELDDLVRSLPIPFVIDHMGRMNSKAGTGQPDFVAMLEWMKLEGAWVKLTCAERMSAWPYTEALPFARALLEARPDRVLWGTDFPHPNQKAPDNVDLVNLVPKYTESDAERQALLVDNPARLYGFD